MATEKTNPKIREKKEAKIDSSESKLKKERRPDPRKSPSSTKQPPGTTREIDFMGWD